MMKYMAAVIFAALFLAACKPEAPAAHDATPAAAQAYTHDSHASADHAEMPAKPATLWATDEPLRKGMDGIARAVTVAESAKSHGAFGEAEAKILASEIQVQFDYMVAN